MTKKTSKITAFAAVGSLLLVTGCQELPGTREQQGAAIGGLSGAAVGAAVGGSENRLLGALLGGALGAGGGYLIGANTGRVESRDTASATAANQRAQTSPVTVEQARTATTADINNDGFVTMDEVIALHRAGLSDEEILDRMRASGQVFELTSQQRDHLRQQGLSQRVLNELPNINIEARERLMSSESVLGRPPTDATR
jgi:osmotically inducible lipoprotein OsmB